MSLKLHPGDGSAGTSVLSVHRDVSRWTFRPSVCLFCASASSFMISMTLSLTELLGKRAIFFSLSDLSAGCNLFLCVDTGNRKVLWLSWKLTLHELKWNVIFSQDLNCQKHDCYWDHPSWQQHCPIVCEPIAKPDCACVLGGKCHILSHQKVWLLFVGCQKLFLQTSGKIYLIPEESVCRSANVIIILLTPCVVMSEILAQSKGTWKKGSLLLSMAVQRASRRWNKYSILFKTSPCLL